MRYTVSEERFVLELPTSRAMLATARPRYITQRTCVASSMCGGLGQ